MRDLIIPLSIAFFLLLSLTPLLFERSNPQELEEMGIHIER